MANPAIELPPRVEDLVTEDDTPVDNFLSEKQQRLLTEPLYSSWRPADGRPFLAAANVGVFRSAGEPPLVPDVFLSLGVTVPEDWWAKRHRCYFLWEFGKPPEVVIEIVSNREGNEAGSKFESYARLGVACYAIYDPLLQIQQEPLRLYALSKGRYVPHGDPALPGVGLGLGLWRGRFEDKEATWLRWRDGDDRAIPTGAERAEQERQRAEQERQRAEQERQRAERMAARLRALGLDPDAE